MPAQHVHHHIEALQQQVASLQSVVASPAQGPGALLEMLEALQVSLQALHVAEGALHQQHDDLVVVHQQAEAGLRDSEARTHAILQTAVDGIITIDERGIVESFNPAAERLFGYTADEIIGQNVHMLMPSPYREEHDSYLARYLQTGDPHIIGIGREVRARCRDGSTFPIALAISEMHLAGHRMFTGIMHDLTMWVQAEKALRHARDELEVRVQERTAELTAAN